MVHASIFSGIGGFDYAAQLIGWENLFHCEINPFGQKILKKHFHNSIIHTDVNKTDFTIYRRRVNVLTGGFPCQDTSVASSNGKLGLKGESSGLWFQMLRAIDEIEPDWAVCENVYGLINQDGGLAIETIISGMEGKGYEVFPPLVIPAAATGANHIRKRVWIIAHTTSIRDRIPKREVQAGWDVIEYGNWWNTEPELCRVYDGLPAGLDKNRLRGLGNAIVPKIALQIFKTIEQFEKLNR